MSGHVPKFGAANGGNFTEVFTLARTGAKPGTGSGSGSSDMAAAAAEVSSRAARGVRGAGAAPRRVSGSGERDVPEPPRRPAGRGSGGGSGGSSGARKSTRNVNEEYAGSTHLPKFGDWNTGDAGDANYTVMFTAASRERQSGSAVELGNKNPSGGRGSGDMGRNSNRSGSKKPSPSWWCFS